MIKSKPFEKLKVKAWTHQERAYNNNHNTACGVAWLQVFKNKSDSSYME
jgi:hypothetical protein